jgi:hypothetical protein
VGLGDLIVGAWISCFDRIAANFARPLDEGWQLHTFLLEHGQQNGNIMNPRERQASVNQNGFDGFLTRLLGFET